MEEEEGGRAERWRIKKREVDKAGKTAGGQARGQEEKNTSPEKKGNQGQKWGRRGL